MIWHKSSCNKFLERCYSKASQPKLPCMLIENLRNNNVQDLGVPDNPGGVGMAQGDSKFSVSSKEEQHTISES